MDDLSTLLRVAAADAPPTRINLDRLVAAERHRSRTMIWTATGTGVAAAVAAVLVAPVLLIGTGPGGDQTPGGLPLAASPGAVTAAPTLCAPLNPSPTAPQPPLQTHDTVRARPTEPVADAVPRLTAALRQALRETLTTSQRAASLQDGCADPQFQFHPSYREYEASARIVRGEDSGFLLIRVMPTGKGVEMVCPSSDNPADCERVQLPDGTVGTVEEMPSRGDQRQLSVLLERRDGTSVWLIANNYSLGIGPRTGSERVTVKELPLTREQMIAIGSHPGLTLYP